MKQDKRCCIAHSENTLLVGRGGLGSRAWGLAAAGGLGMRGVGNGGLRAFTHPGLGVGGGRSGRDIRGTPPAPGAVNWEVSSLEVDTVGAQDLSKGSPSSEPPTGDVAHSPPAVYRVPQQAHTQWVGMGGRR